SCLEFAMLGKPVLTYAKSPERAHLEILGDAAVAYQNAQELKELLRHPASVIRHLAYRGQRPEGGEQRSDVGGRLSVVGVRKVNARRQRATNNQQPTPSTEASDSRFKQYQPEAVMRKFEQVFLK
ncbi:MAG: hypothetical protein RLZZ112_1367, partial [Verrucomicrobiota bacterium]